VKLFKEGTFKVVLLIATVLLGIIGMTVAQPGRIFAASKPAPLAGIVDYSALISNNPATAKANEALKLEQENAQKEYVEKVSTLDDKGKQELERQLTQRIEQKRSELLKPILNQTDATIKTEAEAKGLTIVINKNAVVCGGVDITAEVSKKLNGK
jgi:outer membrane protein